VRIAAAALWMPEVHAADARFSFGLTAFSLGACVELIRRGLAELAACGGAWGGAVHAVVFDLSPVGPGERGWAAVEVAPRLRLHIWGRLHLETGLEVIVPLVRQPFTVIGLTAPVFQQAPLTLLPFAGLGATFP
jgi:hypothetical protein